MTKRKKIWLFIIFLCFVWLVGEHYLLKPWVNSNPVDRVTIRGEFPFEKGWTIEFWKAYLTTNETCGVFPRAFGVFRQRDKKSSRKVYHYNDVKQLSESTYEYQFYKDYYKLGWCGWKSGLLRYSIYDRSGERIDAGTMMQIGKFNTMNYVCKRSTRATYNLKFEKSSKGVVCMDYLNGGSRKNVPGKLFKEVNFIFKDEK